VEALRTMYEPVAPPSPEEADLDEVKKTIQDFRKLYE
jgi:hypothetical protein